MDLKGATELGASLFASLPTKSSIPPRIPATLQDSKPASTNIRPDEPPKSSGPKVQTLTTPHPRIDVSNSSNGSPQEVTRKMSLSPTQSLAKSPADVAFTVYSIRYLLVGG
jgi:hypothetical protein